MNIDKSHIDGVTTMSKLQDKIREVIGPDFIEKSQILPHSKISEDLRLDQFDIFELRDEILNTFGKHCDLFVYMYHLDLDQMINLTVADIADFIQPDRARVN